MTYCVGILLDAGMVFLADSRTNAGVDQISTFRKISVFEKPGERVMVLMSAGNLAISQALNNSLRNKTLATDGDSLFTAQDMFAAARHVGDTLREVHRYDAEALKDHNIEFNASLVFGGQIGREPPRLFCIYAAGNFIEATPDTPYFQIGESKYGKPILDRVVSRSTSVAQAAKCALISMDSTIRSNLSVGLPLDLLSIHRDGLRVQSHVSINEDHDYFRMIRTRWSESLRHAFHELPDPEWMRRS
ncbi:putative proteasome-type protease [Povalibacter uvarum]|uniref:Putative proteasome-type protease n=1 Tax=Povalibacter uvarum TaxID=732238 RepID=A0A841HR76_9GAMM|nr:proteasome-type protease [Povalibacter uvarum]MBB6094532.1 putative proteasome-type protease [Povalibacter uvarum]